MLLFVRNTFVVLTITEPHPASFVTANSHKYVLPSSKYYSGEPHNSTIGTATYALTRVLPWRLVAVIQTQLNWNGCTCLEWKWKKEAVVLVHERDAGVSSVCGQCHVLWLGIPRRWQFVREDTRIWLAQFCSSFLTKKAITLSKMQLRYTCYWNQINDYRNQKMIKEYVWFLKS
jgi:hypothetical protein